MPDDVLFAGYELPQQTPAEPLSADRRRTRTRAALIAAGIHPLTRGPLHPAALADPDQHVGGPRCGSCEHISRNHRGYLKCGRPGAPRNHGPGTDLRAWWPGCAFWRLVEMLEEARRRG